MRAATRLFTIITSGLSLALVLWLTGAGAVSQPATHASMAPAASSLLVADGQETHGRRG